MAAIALAGAGCVFDPPPFAELPSRPPEIGSPVRIEARGEWADIQAAVEVGLTEAEVAASSWTKPDPAFRRYDLWSVTDEPGWLEVRRLPAVERDGVLEERVALESRIGVFGDPDREWRLVKAMEHRLEQLYGRETYPLAPLHASFKE